MDHLDGFKRRTKWFLENRKDLAQQISLFNIRGVDEDNVVYNPEVHELFNLAIPNEQKIQKVLKYLLDENEFLSPYGIRSLSKHHKDYPFQVNCAGESYEVSYVPGESNTHMFGGNSNWRGPIWFPMNFLLIESLNRFYNFYGKSLEVEFPSGSGKKMSLAAVSYELSSRLVKLFLPDRNGNRPCHGPSKEYSKDPYWKDLVLFHEYFHGDTGRGLGASHQTGWTAIVACCLDDIGKAREVKVKRAAQTPAANPQSPEENTREGDGLSDKRFVAFKEKAKVKYGSVGDLHAELHNEKP
eukprot:TRINITY_DN5542_c0_g1_i3.p1 TRINITY_DN5542_c0_g1~~TRINITY_DN5542_c0_g1_i3.p1  ORF type:complete len:298 (+),score=71.11 TRINITY_DN5542_c0_g1_i3:178-1071(+)